jgi:hypothetical protein
MPIAAELVRYLVIGFLLSLAAIISVRLVTGSINTTGLLRSKSPRSDESISPARVQLLVFTLATAGSYLTQVLKLHGAVQLPDVPQHTLIALGGSHSVYLGTKAYAFFSRRAPSQNTQRSKPEVTPKNRRR